ncbi:hypothetical protein [Burkholderia gladioli]|uniref:hypothetical protein n=1 Tax=Burkholderia gladioli TaxID=28095 RepID=UPI00163EECD8|nr:hypothetical protein [Burkholderia gladioli]
MSIQDLRRANLRRWTEKHGIPSKEKSFFSQLLGTGSFGERAARRLEAEYGMGEKFLDREEAPNAIEARAESEDRELSPEASALVAAIEAADKDGIDPKAFSALAQVLTLMRSTKRTGRVASSGSAESIEELEAGPKKSASRRGHAA